MAELSINSFKAKLVGGGARPNLYEVEAAWPVTTGIRGGDSFQFFCQAASIPAGKLVLIDVPFRGRKLKVPGDRTFEAWNITITNDENYQYRKAFEDWTTLINENESNVGISRNYWADWNVFQLNRRGGRETGYKLIGCWPSSVGAIDLSYEATDSIESFPVVLEYQYWTRIDTVGSVIGAVLNAI